MDYSKTGEQLTERFEGLRLTSYRDVAGILTIGYGHTGPDVFEEQTITEERAVELLQKDTKTAVDAVNRLVTVSLTQSQFDSLVDFVFNLGQGRFAGSTMLKLLNLRDYEGAAREFERWSYAGGVQIAGLLRRRQAEAEEFEAPGSTEA